MIVLLSGGPLAVRHNLPTWAGGLVTPTAQHDPTRYANQGRPWAVDNAAFLRFDAVAYWTCLLRWRAIPGCVWVAVPDVVGDSAATNRRWRAWAWLVQALGYPLAYVGQDGATLASVPWRQMAALFIGGTTGWKLGPDAARLIRAARARGLWVHMGRVNTATRTRYANAMGCTSIDGTGWSRFWNEKRRESLPHLLTRQSRLGDVA